MPQFAASKKALIPSFIRWKESALNLKTFWCSVEGWPIEITSARHQFEWKRSSPFYTKTMRVLFF